MTYLIERTSCWHDEDPKVEGATLIKVHELYRSNLHRCPTYIMQNCDNIRKEGDLWVGDCKKAENYYAIHINSLDELNALVYQVGHPIIIKPHDNAEGYMRLEIYDDYRE